MPQAEKQTDPYFPNYVTTGETIECTKEMLKLHSTPLKQYKIGLTWFNFVEFRNKSSFFTIQNRIYPSIAQLVLLQHNFGVSFVYLYFICLSWNLIPIFLGKVIKHFIGEVISWSKR